VIDRTKEFAVRLALGSEPWAVIRLVLFESIRDLSIGVVAGVACGGVACGLLARLLENVAPVDAITTAVAVAIIVATGVAAAFLPAARVLRVQPAGVLRS
jgi:putative ABC transport system permease protein